MKEDSAPNFAMQDLFEDVRIPNIVVAADGSILAFAGSGRLLRHSEDAGRTWSPAEEIGHDAGGSAIVDEETGHVMVVQSRGGYLWRSPDHGKIWTREEITVKPNAIGQGSPDGVPSTGSRMDRVGGRSWGIEVRGRDRITPHALHRASCTPDNS